MASGKGRLALAFVAAVAVVAPLSVSAQTAELNPTVRVLARPQSPVPADCATDNNPASAQPALLSASLASEPQPSPPVASVPPSNDLRTRMRRLQVASEGDDYAGFKTAFEDARRVVASHPAGGERNAANDALQVFADIGRVWDYAMASPTGSFFDGTAQGGSLLAAMKRYPDYGRSIADDTFTAGEKTLYPTRETRRFLAHESSRRLARMGVSTSSGMAAEAPPRHPTAEPTPVRKTAQVATKTPAKTPGKSASTRAGAAKPPDAGHKTPKTAAATPQPKAQHVDATPAPNTKPVTKPATKPVTPPPVKAAATTTAAPTTPVATATTAPPPALATTTVVASAPTTTASTATSTTTPTTTGTSATTTAVATASDTAASASTGSSTDTATAAPDTAATTTSVPVEKQNGNMNLILAVVLILVGIGVLVVLFRASD